MDSGNIYLTGFMGCGKSVVGELLAKRLRMPFIDTDDFIEKEEGMRIYEIFRNKGENYFRSLEKECVKRVVKLKGYVVSLGGGAVMDADNRRKISSTGVTITLSYPSELIAARLARVKDRPLLDGIEGDDLRRRIDEIMKQREKIYMESDLVLHFSKEIKMDRIVDMIVSYLGGRV